MIEKTHAYIECNREALCASLQELVRIPTVNPPGDNYAEIVDLLDERCRELGMQTRIVLVPEAEAIRVVPHADAYPRMNLIARWDLGAEKPYTSTHTSTLFPFPGSGALTHLTLK